jgi:phospholipid/cholesterol/gamma-HCH transport system permease protein
LIDFTDLVPATLKTTVFGFIIAVTSSYLGITTDQGTEGVGRASTRSVVFSSVLLILVNVLLVRLIVVLFPQGS